MFPSNVVTEAASVISYDYSVSLLRGRAQSALDWLLATLPGMVTVHLYTRCTDCTCVHTSRIVKKAVAGWEKYNRSVCPPVSMLCAKSDSLQSCPHYLEVMGLTTDLLEYKL